MSHLNPQAVFESPQAQDELSSSDYSPIDYTEVLADFEPGAPGGVIVFSTCGYATDEEADAAHEAFLREVLEATDEDD